MGYISKIKEIWQNLYGIESNQYLEDFLESLEDIKKKNSFINLQQEWYKDVVLYSIYVDLFSVDFKGLEEKLDYLSELGVNCLWMLPILDSPMRDAGFDIRDYRKIREDLLPLENQEAEFQEFIKKAHSKGIKVIFDIAMNHTSDEHKWFKQAKKSKNNPFRNYYIWSQTTEKYSESRIIFKGIEKSNWKRQGEEYYFHRFFDFQPDLNYRNPNVIIEMTKNLIFWVMLGVDGFRADAIPFLWKEEGTNSENLQGTHNVIKFFRAVLDYIRPNTLLLAEACQKPEEIIKYNGDGDECQAAYDFPLVPMIFKAIASGKSEPIISSVKKQKSISANSEFQWFTFLRSHDEFSLEGVYVNDEDREYLYKNYCKKEEWDFREGGGICARLSELLDRDPRKIALAFSIMLSLPGTTVVYYGDEFGKLNDENYYKEAIKHTGKDDSRFLVRGRLDWNELKKNLTQENSYNYEVYSKVKALINSRIKSKAFGRGDIEFIELNDKSGKNAARVLALKRKFGNDKFLILNNLSDKNIKLDLNLNIQKDFVGNDIEVEDNNLVLNSWGYYWIKL